LPARSTRPCAARFPWACLCIVDTTSETTPFPKGYPILSDTSILGQRATGRETRPFCLLQLPASDCEDPPEKPKRRQSATDRNKISPRPCTTHHARLRKISSTCSADHTRIKDSPKTSTGGCKKPSQRCQSLACWAPTHRQDGLPAPAAAAGEPTSTGQPIPTTRAVL
jgi:hypothetical protein